MLSQQAFTSSRMLRQGVSREQSGKKKNIGISVERGNMPSIGPIKGMGNKERVDWQQNFTEEREKNTIFNTGGVIFWNEGNRSLAGQKDLLMWVKGGYTKIIFKG